MGFKYDYAFYNQFSCIKKNIEKRVFMLSILHIFLSMFCVFDERLRITEKYQGETGSKKQLPSKKHVEDEIRSLMNEFCYTRFLYCKKRENFY